MDRSLHSVQVDLQLQFGPRTPRRGLANFAGSLPVTCSPFRTGASRLTTRGLLLHARRPRASKTSSLVDVLTLCAPSSRQTSRVLKGGRSWLARCWWLATRGWRGYKAGPTSAVVGGCSGASFLLSYSSRACLGCSALAQLFGCLPPLAASFPLCAKLALLMTWHTFLPFIAVHLVCICAQGVRRYCTSCRAMHARSVT